MIALLKKIFGTGPKADLKELVDQGAQIIDVRSRQEFQGGHIHGSMNIPLPELQNNLSRIRKNKPVITCCASGIRSASAKRLLAANGFTDVYNGGGWMSLQHKIG